MEDLTMDKYLDEEVMIKLTRRELYWIREQNKVRLMASEQGMNAITASPAKRSARWHEHNFHTQLHEHLYGLWLDADTVVRERDERLEQMAADAEQQARALAEQAKVLRGMVETT